MKQFRDWMPVVVVVVGVIVGYVQLAAAVKANSIAIERQAVALQRIGDLLVTDARHDSDIAAIRRDMVVMWDEIIEMRRGREP